MAGVAGDVAQSVGSEFRAFVVRLPSQTSYWTVVDEEYRPVEVVDHYLQHLRFGRGRAVSTNRQYACTLALFLSWCSLTGRRWSDAPSDLHLFVMWLRMTPIERKGSSVGLARGDRRINQVLSVVREFFKHAAATGAADPSVLAALYEIADDRHRPAELRPEGGGLRYVAQPRHRLREQHRDSPDAASPEEFLALLRACQHNRERLLLGVLYFCGLRLGEALGLRREDLHFMPSSRSLGCDHDGAHLHVIRRENVNGAFAKSYRSRTVPVTGQVVAFWDLYDRERAECLEARGCDFVLVNLRHRPLGTPMTPSAAEQSFARLVRRAGLTRRVRPHMLRHSFGTELANADVGLDVVQRLMGHALITSTQVYLHPNGERLREAVDRVSARVPSQPAD